MAANNIMTVVELKAQAKRSLKEYSRLNKSGLIKSPVNIIDEAVPEINQLTLTPQPFIERIKTSVVSKAKDLAEWLTIAIRPLQQVNKRLEKK